MAEEKKAPEKFVDTAREELYKTYNQKNPEPKEEPKEEPKVEEPKPEQTPAESEKKEEPKPEVKPEAKKEEKKDKFVPYDALHSERMKRKAEADRANQEARRRQELELELARLKQQPEPEFQTESDKKLYEMEVKLQAIENIEKQRLEREAKQREESIKTDLENRVDKTAKDLADEGYPGLKRHIGEVHSKLRQMVAEGYEEEAIALDNPTGWKKIYREEVYPEIAKEFQEAFKKQSVESKVELKKQAGLVSSPGKTEPKPKSEEDMSEEEMKAEYMKMRRASAKY
jgi:hypothetical protein